MTPLLVDVSVALKWVLVEDDSDRALALFRSAAEQSRSILAPPLLMSEATNALHQRHRRGAISAAQADAALSAVLAFPIHIVSPPDLHRQTMRIARDYGLSATYDAQYLAAALSAAAEFWTADRKLYRTLPRSLTWVNWIGDYPAHVER